MAEQSEKELLDQAKKVQEEANKRAKDLREKAKEIRQKNLANLGELTIKFLQEEISLDELKTFATNHNFLNKKER